MLKIKVNEKEFEIDDVVDWDLLENNSNFHIIKNNVSYRCVLLNKDIDNKKMTIAVNGIEYSINIQDKFDVLLEQLGMSSMSIKKFDNVKAPMPGLVLAIKIKVGDTINEGDTILVLEAMKMENMLKSPGAGVVKSINVKQGEAVEKGQILIEME